MNNVPFQHKLVLGLLTVSSFFVSPSSFAMDRQSQIEFRRHQLHVNHLELAQTVATPEQRALLRGLEIVLIVDRSGSQGGSDDHPIGEEGVQGMKGGEWTQWDSTHLLVEELQKIISYDSDGMIPLYFFDDEIIREDVNAKNPHALKNAFKKYMPAGTTNLLGALERAFAENIPSPYRGERRLFIVVTDGVPDSGQEPRIKDLIRRNLAAVDSSGDYLNILFVQVGNSASATKFLFDLDECEATGEWVNFQIDNDLHVVGAEMVVLNAILEEWDYLFESKVALDQARKKRS